MIKTDLHIAGLKYPAEIFVHGEQELVSQEISKNGVWEPYETNLFTSRLSTGMTFLDVGANIGYYSLIADVLVGESGGIFAFEPEQKNFSLLQQNLADSLCQNVNLFNAGLSNSNEKGELYLSPDNWGDHRISSDERRASQTIDLIVGDELFADKKINFLKIDTQGAEFQVVSGLKETIAANSSWLDMVVEFWPWGLKNAGSSAEELVSLLHSFGLNMSIIDHLGEKLIPADANDLLSFAEQSRMSPTPQGFINLFLSASKDLHTRD